MTIVLYDFEGPLDIATLERPPLCALRALRVCGFLLTPAGWAETPHEQRLQLSLAGSTDIVDVEVVRAALNHTPPREMKMFSRYIEFSPDVVPEEIQGTFGPGRSLPVEVWRGLRPLDRHVIGMMQNNARLMRRALDEMGASIRGAAAQSAQAGWTGEVAHVELRMRTDAARALYAREFHDGHALVLARVAGIRAARRAGELMDLHTQVITGAVELDFRVDSTSVPVGVLCQAHVSSVEGTFFSAGSLLGAVAAAATLADMVRARDPSVVVVGGRIAEEPWLVGDDDELTLGM